MLATEPAIFTEFKLAGGSFFVFGRCVISLFALSATKCDDVSHKSASFCIVLAHIGNLVLPA
jgi:hypothetical protein